MKRRMINCTTSAVENLAHYFSKQTKEYSYNVGVSLEI